MGMQEQTCEAAACQGCPARQGRGGAEARLWPLAAIPSRRIAQMTAGAWTVTATRSGRGTFIIRHRTDGPAGRCALLGFEIRRIDPVRTGGNGTDLETATIKRTEKE